MQGKTRERWEELCAQATVEQDPAKLTALAHEINRLLVEKERRLALLLERRLAEESERGE